MHDKTYLDDHRLRIRKTIDLMKNFIPKQHNIGNIGVSDFDSELSRVFPNTSFIVPSTDFIQKVFQDNARNIVISDIEAENYAPKFHFDAIIFTEVLEHLLTDDNLVINNIHKMLKQNGLLVFSVPNAVTLGNRARIIFGKNIHWHKQDILFGVYGGFGHIREYTFAEVRELLRERFEILCIRGINGYRKGIRRIFDILPKTFSNTIFVIARRK